MTSESVICDSAVVGSSDVVRIGGEVDRSVERRRRRGSVASEDITQGGLPGQSEMTGIQAHEFVLRV